jgi:hypothetical protein
MRHAMAVYDCPSGVQQDEARPSRPSCQLYQGALFRLTLQYARALKPDQIYILSALHHAL